MREDKEPRDEFGIPIGRKCSVDLSFPYVMVEPNKKQWPNNNKFAICMTHDIDMPFRGYSSASIWRILGCKHDLWYKPKMVAGFIAQRVFSSIGGSHDIYFDEWLNYERSIGAKSCFYVSTVPAWDYYGTKWDVKYEHDHAEIAGAIRDVHARGWEIGLHASINSSRGGVARYLREKMLLEALIGEDVYGVRHHFWSPNDSKTLALICCSGFQYDSSLGLNDMPGFRTGMCVPYKPFIKQKFLEIPPTCMDGALYPDGERPREIAKKELLDHIHVVANYNGVAVLDWHLEQWNPENLFGVGKLLIEVIDEIRSEYKNNIWWCTPKELFDWWSAHD